MRFIEEEQYGKGADTTAAASAVSGYPIADYETYPPGSGQTRYLDSVHGNDTTGDGSFGNPWRTLAKALASTATGDTVILRAGNYGLFL